MIAIEEEEVEVVSLEEEEEEEGPVELLHLSQVYFTDSHLIRRSTTSSL